MAKKRSSGSNRRKQSKSSAASRSLRPRQMQRTGFFNGKRLLGFELLEGRRMLAADFGDAPAPYDTLLVDDGAQHQAVGPQLGALRSTEADGQPSANANADTGDDGVTFGAMRVGQLSATVTVNVQGQAGKIDAWIDFNGDGNWGGTGEQIFSSVDVVVGDNELTFDIPSWAVTEATYARFRISVDGELGVSGSVRNGEVEDYQIQIASPVGLQGNAVKEHSVQTDTIDITSLTTADLDGDGDLDILSSSNSNPGVVWYENHGNQNYTAKVISYYEPGAQDVTAVDLDGDGDLDVVITSAYNDRIAWFKNDGSQNFTRHFLVTNLSNPGRIAVADLDGDGDLDLIPAESSGTVFEWYENNGSQVFQPRLVSNVSGGITSVAATDLDGDGDLDLLATTNSQGTLWFENDGIQNFSQQLVSTTGGLGSIQTADLDADGDLDVITRAYSQDEVLWYENDGSQGFTERVVAVNANEVSDIAVADLDGDGDLDIASALSYDDKVVWYKNDGNEAFSEVVLVSDLEEASSVVVADLDGDGDFEVLSASFTASFDSSKIVWYETAYEVTLTPPATTEVAEGSSTPLEYLFQLAGINDSLLPRTVVFSATGTATFGSDYTLSGYSTFDGSVGTIEIPAGMSTASLIATPIDDSLREQEEELVISLVKGNYIVNEPSSSALVITSDELGGDFGNAPSPYPTSLADQGAVHNESVTGGLHLGSTISYEADANPVASAESGDDGILFGEVQIGSIWAEVTVNVQGGSGMLDAWLDFDGNGTWAEFADQIFTSMPVVEGDNVLRFRLPEGAVSGESYARFRLSSTGGLQPTGVAGDGEVEDVKINLLSPARTTGVFEVETSLLTGQLTSEVPPVAIDLDGDDDYDFIAYDFETDTLNWHENLGGSLYETHQITSPDEISYAAKIEAADIDKDGDLDLVVLVDSEIQWFENKGNQEFLRHHLVGDGSYSNDFELADIDGDGTVDIVYSSSTDLVWYRNDGDGQFAFENIEVLNGASTRSDYVEAGDIDNDGDIDLLYRYSSSLGDTYWLSNEGNGQFIRRSVSTSSSSDATLVDLDDDGDLDIVGVFGGDLSVLKNVNGEFALEDDLNSNGNVDYTVSDLDGDGDFDIAASFGNVSNPLYWYENIGDFRFASHAISTELTSAWGIEAVDFDGTGAMGLLVYSGYSSDPLLTYFSQTPRAEIEAIPQLVSETGGEPLVFRISTGATSSSPLSIPFSLAGSAIPEVDYTVSGADSFAGSDGVALIPAGQAFVDIVIQPVDDGIDELFENIVMTITQSGIDGLPLLDTAVALIEGSPSFGDYGDAPSPYPVSPLEDGSGHVATGPILGSTRTTELSGENSPNSDADIGDDGITFQIVRVGDASSQVIVNVQNAPAGAMLDAWIDFNGDGTWLGGGEQIFNSQAVVEGDNYLIFDVPGNATIGETYARFRLSTLGDLGTVGLAADGEVEDVSLTIAPTETGQLTFSKENYFGEYYDDSLPVDFDGDGDTDIVSFNLVYGLRPGLAWLENDGSGAFITHHIATLNSRITTVAVEDYDNDGDLDIIAGVNVVGQKMAIMMFENRGGNEFQEQVIEPSTVYKAREHAVLSIVNADVDADGDIDFLAVYGSDSQFPITSSQGSTDFVWYLNGGDGTFATQRIGTSSAAWIRNAVVIDMDHDGDLDVVANNGTNGILWFENDGSESFVVQELKNPLEVNREFSPPRFSTNRSYLRVADLDGDGDLDLVPVSYIFEANNGWYENRSSGFVYHNLLLSANAWYVTPADYDGDGDVDLVYNSPGGGNQVLENRIAGDFNDDGVVDQNDYLFWSSHYGAIAGVGLQADGNGDSVVNAADYTVWRDRLGQAPQRVFTEVEKPMWLAVFDNLEAVDLDGDGDLDLLSSNHWYSNAPRVSVTASGVDLDETLENSFDFNFSIASPLEEDLELNLVVSGGALAGVDFAVTGADVVTPTAITVTLPAGATSRTLTLTAIDDTLFELDETFTVTVLTTNEAIPAGDTQVTLGMISDEQGGDFGDAPAPYPTLLADDGARHSVGLKNGIQLGSSNGVASEAVPTSNADGDVTDEGVTFSEMIVGGNDVEIVVNVQGASGYLDGWIDFDGNGIWSENEAIFVSQPVSVGDNFLTFNVPINALAGETFVRFRVSSQGDLAPTGGAADGEVEDYLVTLLSSPSVPEETGTAHLVSDGLEASDVVAVDLDQDGDIDLVKSLPEDGDVVWYENKGAGVFTAHTVSDIVSGAASVTVGDFDNDGDIDIVSASPGKHRVYLHTNDGNEGFTTTSVLDSNYVFVDGRRTSTITVYTSPMALQTVDIDGDGFLDVLVSLNISQDITWLHNQQDGTFVRNDIAFASEPEDVFASDLDNDGDIDFLAASSTENFIAWYENDGSQNFTTHFISTDASGAQSLRAVDMDGDGDRDVLAALSLDSRVVWYENDGNENFTVRNVSAQAISPTSTAAVDYDGDGDMDILATSEGTALWYENDGSENFTQRNLFTEAASIQDVIAADIDGDGDLDVIATSQLTSGKTVWFEQHLPGDFNRDNLVDEMDYAFWRDNYGATSLPGLRADANSDGKVDAADYTVWRDHYVAPLLEAVTLETAVSEDPVTETPVQKTSEAPASDVPVLEALTPETTVSETLASETPQATAVAISYASLKGARAASFDIAYGPVVSDSPILKSQELLLVAFDEAYQAFGTELGSVHADSLSKLLDRSNEEEEVESVDSIAVFLDQVHARKR